MWHPRRNEVFRDVGSEPRTPEEEDFIEIVETDFEPDSALLLCSDGLSDLLTSAQIQRQVEETVGNPKLAVQCLIEAANAAGGKDNITVILIENELFEVAVRKQNQEIAQRKPTSANSLKSDRLVVEPMPLWREILNSRAMAFVLGTLCGAVLLGLWQFLVWPRLIK
jgi:hypothetical protein